LTWSKPFAKVCLAGGDLLTRKKQTQDVPEDLPSGTFVTLDDQPLTIFRIEKTTPNGLIFTTFATWRATSRIFRYRHAVHQMTVLRPYEVRDFVLRAFDRNLLERGDKGSYRSAPTLKMLQGFRNLWGVDVLVRYLLICGTFQTQPRTPRGHFQRTDASVEYLLKVVTERKHRRLLAKARCPNIRALFGGQPVSHSLGLH
jgi:hypothetical protein